jgi:DNA-binding transcriptional LysR family regulator
MRPRRANKGETRPTAKTTRTTNRGGRGGMRTGRTAGSEVRRAFTSLPSLNALHVFETAARHQSFTRAAGELGVTQTAVSHQIKALEAELGVTLFRRSPRGLALTTEGQAWAAELRPVFRRLREASTKLRSRALHERPMVGANCCSMTTTPLSGRATPTRHRSRRRRVDRTR